MAKIINIFCRMTKNKSVLKQIWAQFFSITDLKCKKKKNTSNLLTFTINHISCTDGLLSYMVKVNLNFPNQFARIIFALFQKTHIVLLKCQAFHLRQPMETEQKKKKAPKEQKNSVCCQPHLQMWPTVKSMGSLKKNDKLVFLLLKSDVLTRAG